MNLGLSACEGHISRSDKMKEITIDNDMKFEDYKKSRLFENSKRFCAEQGFRLYIRRSSRGNVHVKVMDNEGIDFDELFSFKVRALLSDDPNRLKLDLIRSLMNKSINRLWDHKFKDGKLNTAGRWQRVILIRKDK